MQRCAVPKSSLRVGELTDTHAGISFKTQALYVGVFFSRYLDLFMGEWVSLYNTLMKLFFMGSSCYILWLMKHKFR
jgi:ER lumen protein retaining receptor